MGPGVSRHPDTGLTRNQTIRHSQQRPSILTLIFDTVMHTQYLEMSEKIFNCFIYTLRSANALRVYAASSWPVIG